jgi:hypothetical protein
MQLIFYSLETALKQEVRMFFPWLRNCRQSARLEKQRKKENDNVWEYSAGIYGG